MAVSKPLLLLLFITSASLSISQSITQIPRASIARKSNGKNKLYCSGWRLSVETNNAGSWSTVPLRCERYVQLYMTGVQYLSDSKVVTSDALAFAKEVNITGHGKDAWVFDIDETLLSNLPYYANHGFGTEPFNEKMVDDWVDRGKAPALPASLELYNELKQLGFKMLILTGRSEHQRNITTKNLLTAGYTKWDKLILRGDLDQGKKATLYKSEKRRELINEGYIIRGSCGDQWSDLLGFAMATRSFKLPNPMYYVG